MSERERQERVKEIERVFVVVASTRDYSSGQEWPVRAFVLEESARAYIAKQEPLIKAAAEAFRVWDDVQDYGERYDRRRKTKLQGLARRFPVDVSGIDISDRSTEVLSFSVYEIGFIHA